MEASRDWTYSSAARNPESSEAVSVLSAFCCGRQVNLGQIFFSFAPCWDTLFCHGETGAVGVVTGPTGAMPAALFYRYRQIKSVEFYF